MKHHRTGIAVLVFLASGLITAAGRASHNTNKNVVR